MQVKLVTKKYIEESSVLNEFTCVYTHIPQDNEVFEVRGQMFTMVNMKGPQGLDAITAVNAFLDKLEEMFFSSHPLSIPTLLERAVKDALFALNTYLESTQMVEDIIFDFACVVVKDDVLYVGKVEEGCIYLIRDNKVLDLGRSLFDISNPKLVENGSGILQVGDKLIIANTAADALVADWSLLSRYSEGEINRLIDPATDGMDKASFLIVELEQEDVPAAEIAPPVIEENIPHEEEKKKDEPIIPGLGGELPEPVPVMAKPGAMAAIIQIGDQLGERLIGFGSIVFAKLKALAIFLYSHRQEAIDFVRKMLNIIMNRAGKPDVAHLRSKATSIISEDALGIGKLTANFKKSNAIENKKKDTITELFLKKKMLLIPAGVIFFILFFVIFFNIKSHADYQARVDQYNQIDATIQRDLTEAQGATDVTEIDNLYKDIQKQVTKGLTLNINNNALKGYQDQITQIENSTHHIVAVSNPTVLSDLSLSFSDTKPNGITFLGDNKLLVTSANASSAYILDSTNPSTGSKVTNSLVTGPVSAAALNTTNAVIFDKNNGVLEIGTDSSVKQIPGLGDIKNILDITTFQGNIYMLDATDTAIYKSLKVGSGYSLANPFITDSALANATSLAVDGNVFTSSPSSGITRYFSAKTTPFKIGQLDAIGKPLGPITQIATDEHWANLYVLDPQNSRIIILQKPTGSDTVTYTFLKQIVYSGNKNFFNNLEAITVDSTEKNLYVLDGPKVLKISL